MISPMKIRSTFPQVYTMEHPVSGKYWLVSARSKKWGMNERTTFKTETEALSHARQIEAALKLNGAQPQVPKEKVAYVAAYEKLVERLSSYGKTPENAVDFYITHLGNEVLRQAKPFLNDLVDNWESEKLTSKIKPLAERTKPELKQYARYLRRTWGEQKAQDITRKMVEDALNKLPVKNRNTHRKYLRYIRMFFIWLKDHKHNSENPTDSIKIKGESYEANFYKPDAIEKLLRHVLQPEHKDLIGFYALLIFAGLRPSEGTRVLWQDIDFNTGELFVRKGKKEARRFILHPTALEWMRFHKEKSPKDAPFVELQTLANREKKVRSIFGSEWIQDGLRHGMATYYNALIGDAYKVASVLGDNIQTVKRHYMRAVAQPECKAFWELTPTKVLKSEPQSAVPPVGENTPAPAKTSKQ